MRARRFRPTLRTTVAAIAGIALAAALGVWQLDRAAQKEAQAARQAQLDRAPPIRLGHEIASAAALEQRHVAARGHFEPGAVVWLDNRVRSGIVGYEVVMPLRISGTATRVLVNRGWVGGTGDRRQLPQLATPSGELEVSGRAVVPGKRIYELGSDAPEGRVWQNLTIDRYRARLGIEVLPIMIEQENDNGDGLVRAWPAPGRGADTNRSYAVQWFGLGVLIACAYIYSSVRLDAPNA